MSNTGRRARKFDGLSVLSHGASNNGGVAVLFSKTSIPSFYHVEEIINGRLLKIST